MKVLLLPPGILLLAVVSCGVRARTVAVNGALPPPPVPTQARAVEADDDEGRRAETPGQAAAFYLLKRTGGAPLPVEKLLAAKRHKDSMQAWSIASRRPADSHVGPGARDANVGTWQPLGPGNIGGPTRSLVIRPDDPNTMYAGAVGGGVWKTTDGGNTWNPLTDFLPSIGIGTLAMDPDDPNTIYAGDPVHSCTKSADFKTLWFSLTAPKAGKASVFLTDTQANGADAGAVLSLYTLVNGKPGQEFGCVVIPQTKSGSHQMGLSWTSAGGATYLIEVSATTSGAAADAKVMGGNVQLLATLQSG